MNKLAGLKEKVMLEVIEIYKKEPQIERNFNLWHLFFLCDDYLVNLSNH